MNIRWNPSFAMLQGNRLRQSFKRWRQNHLLPYRQITQRTVCGLTGFSSTDPLPKPSLVLVVVWLGPLPFWMPAFLLSCRYNQDVHWKLFSDSRPPDDLPQNVEFIAITHASFSKRASEALGVNVEILPGYAYKLCDLKIAYGEIFKEELQGYDFWGCCDLDAIWGNIRSFFTPEMLWDHDILTSRPRKIAGHFCLFRNLPLWNRLFLRIPNFEQMVAIQDRNMRMDEDALSDLLQDLSPMPWRLGGQLRPEEEVPRLFWHRLLTTTGGDQLALEQDANLALHWNAGRTYGAAGEELLYLSFNRLKDTIDKQMFSLSDAPKQFKLTSAGFRWSLTPHAETAV